MRRTRPRPAWLLLLLTALAVSGAWAASGETLPGFRLLAAGSASALYFNDSELTFYVEDLRNGHRWASFVERDHPAFVEANDFWKGSMRSLFTLTFVDFVPSIGAAEATAASSVSTDTINFATEAMEVELYDVPDGVGMTFTIPRIELRLAAELSLAGDAIEFTVPFSSIVEGERYGLVSLEVLPFLGSAAPEDDGYMLLPDGPGAIYRFKQTDVDRGSLLSRIRWEVYSPLELDFDRIEERRINGDENCHMPVFGTVLGENAIFGIVDEGDADATITFYQSAYAVALNRVSPELVFRHPYDLFVSDVNVRGAFATDVAPLRYDAELTRGDRTVRYSFLHGEAADYAGMANVYRSHLVEQGELPDRAARSDLPLVLSLFGGVVEDRILVDRYVAMTTFDEASTIVESLRESGVDDLVVNLVGWEDDGYGHVPHGWPPDRRLGGRGDLAKLGRTAAEHGVDLYLQTNPLEAIGRNRGFNSRTQVAKLGSTLSATSFRLDLYAFSPQIALERFARVAENASGEPIAGFSLDRVGDLVYQDYNRRWPSSREETLASWRELLAISRQVHGSAAVVGANIATVGTADIVFDVPVESSGYVVIDHDVPFLQMVIHGSVPYVAQPGNLFHDAARQMLRWIEYGCLPYFELTYEPSEYLKYTDYNHLFSSHYEEWIDRCAEIHDRFRTDFAHLAAVAIVDHEIVAEDLVRVTYADGTRVLLNYRESAARIDGVAIDSLDYVVVRGGQQ